MSDSSDNIQSALCELIEKVEAATSKVVDQRTYNYKRGFVIMFVCCAVEHLAVAQEVGLKIGTFKPSKGFEF